MLINAKNLHTYLIKRYNNGSSTFYSSCISLTCNSDEMNISLRYLHLMVERRWDRSGFDAFQPMGDTRKTTFLGGSFITLPAGLIACSYMDMSYLPDSNSNSHRTWPLEPTDIPSTLGHRWGECVISDYVSKILKVSIKRGVQQRGHGDAWRQCCERTRTGIKNDVVRSARGRKVTRRI